MLREPPRYLPRTTPFDRKPTKYEGGRISRNTSNLNEKINEFPISTPINKGLDELLKNKKLGENIRKIIRLIQTKYIPQLNKLEVLLLNNPTYIYITKIIGISKENTLRITGIVALAILIYTINSLCRRHKSLLLDIFIYTTPAISLYNEIIKKEPDLLDEKPKKNFLDAKDILRRDLRKCHQLKTWLIYLLVSSLFNITDNFFINKSKPIIEPSVTQTVITTTPYLLRDTNKQIYTTIAQVTPFSQRLYSNISQRIKNTIKYSWYWVFKSLIVYWMGYKNGREILYQRFAIPIIKKCFIYEIKSKRSISDMDISFEDSDSFSKNYQLILPNHPPKISSNTRDQGLLPLSSNNSINFSNNVYFNDDSFINTNSNYYYSTKGNKDNSKKDELSYSGYFSDSFYESNEALANRLNNNNNNLINSIKYSSSSNKMVQSSDSLSVEDPWKSNSFIGSSNTPKRNRSFSLNSINHSNNSLNNYRATIYDVNNKLSEYYNDTSFENNNNNNNNNETYYISNNKAKK